MLEERRVPKHATSTKSFLRYILPQGSGQTHIHVAVTPRSCPILGRLLSEDKPPPQLGTAPTEPALHFLSAQ